MLDADITFAAYNRGTSRVIADGVVGVEGKPVVVSARDLHVRVAPLQIDIVKLLFPTLPIGGTLTGTTTLNGSGRGQLVASNVDVVHVRRTEPLARRRPCARSTRRGGRRWTSTFRRSRSRSPS